MIDIPPWLPAAIVVAVVVPMLGLGMCSPTQSQGPPGLSVFGPVTPGNCTKFQTATQIADAGGGCTVAGGTLVGTYYGSGQPWVDVKSGANSCAAAAGNGSTNDQPAIQCQINFMNATYLGGIVFFPPGNYHITSTLTVPQCIQLRGPGWSSTVISATTDITMIAFTTPGCQSGGGIRDLQVAGFQMGTAVNNMITVATNALIDVTDAYLSGGNWAVQTAGVDGHWTNVQIFGWGSSGGGILSTGANWYNHVKIDQGVVATLAAFEQGASPATAFENAFVNSDFSGSYTDSVLIADTNNRAITKFVNCVFSSAISITGGRYTMFTSIEFGAAVASSVNESVVSSFGFSALTFTGTGTRNCAANSNITC